MKKLQWWFLAPTRDTFDPTTTYKSLVGQYRENHPAILFGLLPLETSIQRRQANIGIKIKQSLPNLTARQKRKGGIGRTTGMTLDIIREGRKRVLSELPAEAKGWDKETLRKETKRIARGARITLTPRQIQWDEEGGKVEGLIRILPKLRVRSAVSSFIWKLSKRGTSTRCTLHEDDTNMPCMQERSKGRHRALV